MQLKVAFGQQLNTVLGQRKTTEDLDRVDRSYYLQYAP